MTALALRYGNARLRVPSITEVENRGTHSILGEGGKPQFFQDLPVALQVKPVSLALNLILEMLK